METKTLDTFRAGGKALQEELAVLGVGWVVGRSWGGGSPGAVAEV